MSNACSARDSELRAPQPLSQQGSPRIAELLQAEQRVLDENVVLEKLGEKAEAVVPTLLHVVVDPRQPIQQKRDGVAVPAPRARKILGSRDVVAELTKLFRQRR